jgi:predicted nucleic acid-binding protein
VSILVDTGAWYALADRADRHHQDARDFYSNSVEQDTFVTTDLIAAETWSLLHAHLGRSAAGAFWAGLRETQTEIMTASPVDLEAAWRISQGFSDQTFSFVDCVTVALMERTGISDAFTFDSHFLVYRYGPDRRRIFRRLP